MTDGLSRRDLVALTGVGLMASACRAGGRAGEDSTAAVEPRGASAGRILSAGEDWGISPHLSPPTSRTIPMKYPEKFDPKYISLLYFGLNNDWTVDVNHAVYEFAGDDKARRDKAIEYFGILVKNSTRLKDIGNPYARKGGADGVDFSYFKFKSPNELFIYIHQKGLKKEQETKISLDKSRLLSFGSRLQEEVGDIKKNAERNHAFFNVNLIDGIGDLDRVGKMMRVENWARGENGVEITDPNLAYSMNIHFTIPGGGNLRIPMILDPDTGNGAGNEP